MASSRPFLEKLAWLGLVLTCVACAPTAQRPQVPEPEPPPVEAEVEPEPVGPVRVALLLPLTGNAAAIGQDMLDAASLALFEVGPTDMELLPRDTGGTQQGAVAAARSAIDAGAELILGPLFAASTAAVAPVAREAGLKVLSFSNDAGVAGEDVWVLGFGPEEQVGRVVGFARAQGLRDIAVLAPDNAYGTRAVEAWRGAMADRIGWASTAFAFYPTDERETARIVRELTGYREPPDDAPPGTSGNTRRFDAILLADGGSRLLSIAALLAYYDVDIETTRPLGTMLWEDDPRLKFESTVQGAWFASLEPEGERAFQARFEEVFGRRPASLAGLAYDATALAAFVAARDRGFAAEELQSPGGFIGRAGIFRLHPDGVTEHGLAVLEIDNGTARVVDPAPASFEPGA